MRRKPKKVRADIMADIEGRFNTEMAWLSGTVFIIRVEKMFSWKFVRDEDFDPYFTMQGSTFDTQSAALYDAKELGFVPFEEGERS